MWCLVHNFLKTSKKKTKKKTEKVLEISRMIGCCLCFLKWSVCFFFFLNVNIFFFLLFSFLFSLSLLHFLVEALHLLPLLSQIYLSWISLLSPLVFFYSTLPISDLSYLSHGSFNGILKPLSQTKLLPNFLSHRLSFYPMIYPSPIRYFSFLDNRQQGWHWHPVFFLRGLLQFKETALGSEMDDPSK